MQSEFKKDYLSNFNEEFTKTFLKEIDNYNFGYPSPPLLGKKLFRLEDVLDGQVVR